MSWTYYIDPATGETQLDASGEPRRDPTAASLILFTLRRARVVDKLRAAGAPTRGEIRESVKRALRPLEDAGRIADVGIDISQTRPMIIRITARDTAWNQPITSEVPGP